MRRRRGAGHFADAPEPGGGRRGEACLDGTAKGLDWPARLLMWLSAVVGLVMMLHIAADVTGRVLFNSPLDGTIEIVSGYYMVAVTFLPLAYVTRYEGHIIVELFTRKLPQPRLMRLDATVNVLTLVYMSAFTWMTAKAAVQQTEVGELWESASSFIPIWPSRWFLPLGCLMMSVHLLVRIVRDFRGAGRTGRGGR